MNNDDNLSTKYNTVYKINNYIFISIRYNPKLKFGLVV